MFNPLFPFTKDVLEALVKEGCHYFVRNNYPNAYDHFNTEIKRSFLITHYTDKAKAEAHYNSTPKDQYRFIYYWNIPEHHEKLKVAASQPKEYKIFSTYFYPDYKKKITPILLEKINKYMYRNTNWKPGKGESVGFDIYIQFGSLYATMSYAGEEITVKLADIENQL